MHDQCRRLNNLQIEIFCLIFSKGEEQSKKKETREFHNITVGRGEI